MSVPTNEQPTQPPATSDGTDTDSREELTVQIELLRERNRQLREEYLRSQQQTYRHSALGLLGVGLIGLAAGAVFVEARTVLIALGATGVFAGVLTYFLTPERFIAASVSGGVYEALATDREAMLDELGLSGSPVYVPADTPRVYVPETDPVDATDLSLPASDELTHLFVTDRDGNPGVAMAPTGGPLLEEFTRALTTPLASTPQPLADQLADGLVESFELADGVDTSVDDGGRVTVEFTGLAYGRIDRIDHPVCSLVATGLAVGLDAPIRVEVDKTDPPLVTYRWDPSSRQADSSTETDAIDS
ncbi:hypothetical protein [Halorubrum lacusprofundi]|jgi:hypothetical protein|uniref:hypothetical protein n=1 Tax=Halorubrum lacusprofundi TaxID=2247 RepID=UPI000B5A92BC|nr:hypothetical protein [Halorubrum lacusprofundi]